MKTMKTRIAPPVRETRQALYQLMHSYKGLNGDLVESEFSRNHAWATPKDPHVCCWICHFPIGGKDQDGSLQQHMDHVIPKSIEKLANREGIKLAQPNILRPAHRRCNISRHEKAVTRQHVLVARQYMLDAHWEWLIDTDSNTTLIPKYMEKTIKGANPNVRGSQPWLVIPRAVAAAAHWFKHIHDAQQYVADHPEFITMHSPEDDVKYELDEYFPSPPADTRPVRPHYEVPLNKYGRLDFSLPPIPVGFPEVADPLDDGLDDLL